MSDAVTNTTTLATILPSLVYGRLNYYYEKVRLFRGLIGEQYRFLVPSTAKSVVVSTEDTLTMQASTEGTFGDDAEAFTTIGRTLTPIVLQTNILESLEADASAPIARAERYANAAGTAWAFLEDSNTTYGFPCIAAADADTSNDLGADSTALTAALVRQGVAKLMTAGAGRPYHYVIDPIQFEELMRDAEAKQWLMSTRGGNAAATYGVNPDRYLGTIYGTNVWVADAMRETSGLHSIMFGTGALGQAYKMVATDPNPTPAEFHMSIQWQEQLTARRIFWRVYMVNSGIYQHATGATHNTRLVDIIS